MEKDSFKGREISFLIFNALFTIVLFGTHQYILSNFFEETAMYFPLWHIYVFLFVITSIFYTVINYRFSTGHKNVFTIFMGGTLLKMVLAVVFLLPMIMSEFENKQPDIINFFIAYFAYLFFEVYSLTKLLQKA